MMIEDDDDDDDGGDDDIWSQLPHCRAVEIH